MVIHHSLRSRIRPVSGKYDLQQSFRNPEPAHIALYEYIENDMVCWDTIQWYEKIYSSFSCTIELTAVITNKRGHKLAVDPFRFVEMEYPSNSNNPYM